MGGKTLKHIAGNKKKWPGAIDRKPRLPKEPLLDKGKREQLMEFLGSVGYKGGRGKKNPLYSDKELTIKAIRKYMEIFGEFPTHHTLRAQNLYVLNHVISRHGGFTKLKEEMGLAKEKRPNRDDFENPKKHLVEFTKKLMEDLGHFPKKKELQERKLWWVFDWAREEFEDGMTGLRKAVGAKHHNWGNESLKNWENMKRELLSVKEELGHEPSWTELEELGRYDILNAREYHGGLIAIRKKLGWTVLVEEPAEFEKLKEWNYFEKRMEGIIKKNNGSFPTHRYLISIHESRMIKAAKSFGGLPTVAVIMGYTPSRRLGKIAWKHWINVKRELKGMEEELGYPPGWYEIRERIGPGFLIAIQKHHGGMSEARKKLGWPVLIKKKKEFRTWKEFSEYANSITNLFGELPSYGALNEMGYGEFLDAVKDFGGMGAVRMRLGVKVLKRPEEKSYKYWNNVRIKLAELTDMLGTFPPYAVLEQQPGLISSMWKHHGGYNAVKDKFLGVKPKQNKKKEISVSKKRAELFYNAKEGDKAARAEIIKLSRPRVRRLSLRYDYSGQYRDDMEQEAASIILGFLEKRDTPAAFYGGLTKHLRAEIIKYLSKQWRKGIIVTRDRESAITALKKTHTLLSDKYGRKPTPREILKVLPMEEWELVDVMALMEKPISLDYRGDGKQAVMDTKEISDANELAKEKNRVVDKEWLAEELRKKGKNDIETAIISKHLADGMLVKDIARQMDLPRRYVKAVIRGTFTKTQTNRQN